MEKPPLSPQTDLQSLLRHIEGYRRADPLLFLKGLSLARDMTGPDQRFVRSEILQALAARLLEAVRMCDFRNDIVVRPEGIFVDVGGILMESSQTQIYLKSSGVAHGRQAAALSQTLRRLNMDISTIVDIGANVGEISLGLARDYPKARIVAVEPSSAHVSIFALNKSVQNFPTQNIEIVQQGITGRTEVAFISKIPNVMNRVVETSQPNMEAVKCEPLDVLFDRLGIQRADFVKIDIEGGEPKLREAVTTLGSRIRSYYIEFSQFAPLEDYLTLAEALRSQDFTCYDEAALEPLTTTEAIAAHLRSAFASSNIAVTNLWFVAGK